ncbi:hypothetical protein DMA11_04345 [Marinilabiliaceae bacterium JC017]|nr:hypothetical protein DMA11_04345 [Marinilabiliaceae bacterium JC017]
MHYTKLKKDEFLDKTKRLIRRSKDEKMREAFLAYGYNDQRLSEGEEMYSKLSRISDDHVMKARMKVYWFSIKQEQLVKARKMYMKYLKIARITFDDNEDAKKSLLLEGPRARTYKEWFYQASLFCRNITRHEEFLEPFSRYGVQVTHIAALRAELDKLSELSDKCVKISGELKKLTREKKEMTITFQHWISDYIKIARIALENDPAILEGLGVSVRY